MSDKALLIVAVWLVGAFALGVALGKYLKRADEQTRRFVKATIDAPCSHRYCRWIKDEERYDCEVPCDEC